MLRIKEDQLKEIVQLTNTVPQEFRAKCFELLLSYVLHEINPPIGDPLPPKHEPKHHDDISHPSANIVVPIDVKAFLSQYKLPEDILSKLFLIRGEEVRPLYHLKSIKKAESQIHLALLISLENAIKTGRFEVDSEMLRTRCEDTKCYDNANFVAILERKSNLFKKITKGKPLMLSPDGKAELADIIDEITRT